MSFTTRFNFRQVLRKGSLLLILVASGLVIFAQQKRSSYDSSFFKTYYHQVTGRAFISKKYTGLTLEGPTNLKYRPNNFISTGVGATYGAITVNLGFNLGFLNTNRDEKGKTKSIDLQSHIYTQKWVIDLYGQFYKGYFLSPKGLASTEEDVYYLRKDLKVNLLGASVYRLLNGNRFSYRAGFLQNEWQQKSAGSLLVGAEIYTGVLKGDSSLIPGSVSQDYAQRDIRKLSFTEFGPGIGYAYTLVYHKNFFITASATVNGDISFVKEYLPASSESKTSISPNLNLRGVAGYNSDNWIATVSWINNTVNLRGASSSDQYLVKTGNIRLTIAKRFKAGKKLRTKLKVIDQLPVTK